jgi:peptide/nickel transport system permease protein/oligopeptide transport system permease protein
MNTRLRTALTTIGQFRKAPGAAASLLFLLTLVLVAVFADLLPLAPFRQNLVDALQGPSTEHWFGTDELGRDILSRVIYGARTSLLTAAGAVAISASIGVSIGLVSGFFGGWRDAVLMRFVDVLLALPSILFAMALIAVLGRSQMAAIFAVGLTGIPNFARIVRAQTLTLKNRDFVVAVEAFGGSSSYNMFRVILPNSWSPILVQVVVLCSVAILLEAALSFLGIGVAPPTPSWGEMLRSGKTYLYEAPYYSVLPGVVLTLTVLCFDSVGRRLATLLEDRHSAFPGTKVQETTR